ncbi:hypothetical protein J6590_076756 [Homalodisca vitripennis]|nr:hypothetical protein J6590_076756 [Homalodisca vitripennis]
MTNTGRWSGAINLNSRPSSNLDLQSRPGAILPPSHPPILSPSAFTALTRMSQQSAVNYLQSVIRNS